jgi:hypothetical protein
MARLTGPPPFVGTRFGITIYEMWGAYYMRTKTSLDAERVKTDPAYRPLMKYAAMLSCASPIAAAIYRLLPAKGKKHSMYKTITGKAIQLLKQGCQPEEVGELLLREYVLPTIKDNSKKGAKQASSLRVPKPRLSLQGFSFAGEYYSMSEFSKLLSTLNNIKRRRRKRKSAPGGSVLAYLARKPNCEL